MPFLAVFRNWLRHQASNTVWPQWLGLLSAVAGAMLLLIFADLLAGWQLGLAGATLGLLAALSLRRGWVHLLGPVFFYDVVRGARRTRSVVLRIVYAATLALLLCFVYAGRAGSPEAAWQGLWEETRVASGEMAAFASSFFSSFLIAQFLVVIVLTPAFTAGAIAEEKETKTLQYLLTTDLASHEIILGKLGARLASLTLLLLTGLPVLSLLQLLGGVDPNLVVAGFAATALTMLGLASVSILTSVHCDRPRDAIFYTYILAATYILFSATCFSEVPVLNWGSLFHAWRRLLEAASLGSFSSELPVVLGHYALFHGTLSVVCILLATLALRPSFETKRQKPEEPERILEPRDFLDHHDLRRVFLLDSEPGPLGQRRPPPRLVPRRREARRARPRIGADPMRWKEMYVEQPFDIPLFGVFLLKTAAIIILTIALLILFCGVMISLIDGHIGQFINSWIRPMGTGAVCVMMLGAGLRAAGCLVGERERYTLDSLLTTDLDRREILAAKWYGCWWSVRSGALALGVLLGLGLITTGIHPFAIPLLAAAYYVYVTFAINVGLYCSQVCRTTWRATVATALTLLGASFGHWLLYLFCTPFLYLFAMVEINGLALDNFHTYALTPPITLWELAFPVGDLGRGLHSHGFSPLFPESLPYAVVGLGIYALATLLFWFAVKARFSAATARVGE
jgi:ABC-type transport system involved in multi-copper enzyme maturation permease subunit